jgi:hypothetical protein
MFVVRDDEEVEIYDGFAVEAETTVMTRLVVLPISMR